MNCTICGRPMDPNAYEWCDGNCQPRRTYPCQCGAPVVSGTCTGNCFSQPLEAPVAGKNFVSYVPALVLPMADTEADTDAGTEAGTKTSTYKGLRGVALMKRTSRKEALVTLQEVVAVVTFITLMCLAWIGTP